MGGNRHSIFGEDAVTPPPPTADEAEESTKKLKMIDYEDEEEGNQVSSPLNSDDEEEEDKDEDEDEDEVEYESGEYPKPIGDVVRVSGKGESTRNHFKGFEYDGRSYELEDTVLLAPEEQSLKPSVAIIKDITEMQDGSVIITVQRFYRPEEAENESNENYEARELFYSFAKNKFPAESVMHKCRVHFIPPKKQVPSSKDHPGFIVRKIYDPKSKGLSELLNMDYDDLRRHEIGKNKFELRQELQKLFTMSDIVNKAKSLRSILEKERLNGTNFLNWYKNLRIVLKQEKKLYVLEKQVPDEPARNAFQAVRDAFRKHKDDALDVGCLMFISMEPELQKQHKNMGAFDMIEHLKLLFQKQVRQERYETSSSLFQCKMVEGTPVGPHVLKMIGYIERLEGLGFPLRPEVAIDIILQSLPKSYSEFIMNFNMHSLEKTLSELLNMLRTAETELLKNKPAILMVSKRNKKGNGKSSAFFTPKSLKPKKGIQKKKSKGTVPKDAECFHCKQTGHWKRNCPQFLMEKKKGCVTSTLGTVYS